jgi:hypothetical protein
MFAQAMHNPPAFSMQLQAGDLVFIRVPALPFKKVASATSSWTNHVGLVVDTAGKEPVIAESTFPLSRITPLSRFVARSEQGKIEVKRLNAPLNQEQLSRIVRAAQERLGIFYDTGFNLHSKREFCSRFVREVLSDATGHQVGEVETFSTLFRNNPKANLTFWRIWYFGKIPWQRETVTPASLLRSKQLRTVFEGFAT